MIIYKHSTYFIEENIIMHKFEHEMNFYNEFRTILRVSIDFLMKFNKRNHITNELYNEFRTILRVSIDFLMKLK